MLPTVLMMLVQPPQPAEPPKTFEEALAVAEARDMVLVPAGLTRIQEKALPRDSAAPAKPAGGRSRGLPNLLTGERGMRLLLFDLVPGERIQFKLVGESVGNLLLSIAPPAKPDGMERESTRVNRMPANLRTRELSIENITPAVYPLLLRMTGTAGQPYVLEVVRKPPAAAKP